MSDDEYGSAMRAAWDYAQYIGARHSEQSLRFKRQPYLVASGKAHALRHKHGFGMAQFYNTDVEPVIVDENTKARVVEADSADDAVSHADSDGETFEELKPGTYENGLGLVWYRAPPVVED